MNSPPPRLLTASAYDGARAQVVLFGGLTISQGPHYFADTWVWDGTNWVEKAPLNSPPPRQLPGMAYDAARSQVVLFGGAAGTFFNDTWTWDGDNWTQVIPVTSPSARQGAAMAYDEARGQVVMFGGRDTNAGPSAFNDTWLWNGTDWSLQSPASSPPQRFAPSIAYDSDRREVMLFGGFNIVNGALSLRNDTWVWDGANWTQLDPVTSPPPLYQPAMADAAAVGQVVLFGGRDSSGLGRAETWIWDGTTWRQTIPENSPTARYQPVMAYDAARGEVVLFGGGDNSNVTLGDTWVWGPVGDRTPPVLSVPASVMAEATGPNGASVGFAASAVDVVDGPVSPACLPSSGSMFVLGETTVNCSATDTHGNTATASFLVNVVDTTPPTLTLPVNLVIEATGPGGAVVVFSATAADLVDGPVPVDCSPASGGLLAIGTTTVTCSASDTHGNRAIGSFEVTVVDTTPPTLTTQLVALSRGGSEESEQLFRVVFSSIDSVSVVSTTASLNGVPVTNGQVVKLKLAKKGAQKTNYDDGILKIQAVSLALTVTVADAAGNSRTAIAAPVFNGHGD